MCTLGHNISCEVMTTTGTLVAGPEELLGRGGAGEELLCRLEDAEGRQEETDGLRLRR